MLLLYGGVSGGDSGEYGDDDEDEDDDDSVKNPKTSSISSTLKLYKSLLMPLNKTSDTFLSFKYNKYVDLLYR